jgi:hypothetical protein
VITGCRMELTLPSSVQTGRAAVRHAAVRIDAKTVRRE